MFCRFGLFDCLCLWFVFRLEFVCLGIISVFVWCSVTLWLF